MSTDAAPARVDLLGTEPLGAPHRTVLRVVPSTLRAANDFIAAHHRHHKPARGCRFVLAVADATGAVRGVAVVGRPTSRMLQAKGWLEVTRLCTDGAPGACSMLYRRAQRVTQLLGHARLVTFTLPEEGGASLRALKDAGWQFASDAAGGGSWSRDDRPRVDAHPLQLKLRWEAPAAS